VQGFNGTNCENSKFQQQLIIIFPKLLDESDVQLHWIHDHGTGIIAGVIDQKGILTPPRYLIPPPVYLDVRVTPFISLINMSYMYFETDHSLVSWPFH
jgi:hypothetical protein